jgi:hypothetical protein
MHTIDEIMAAAPAPDNTNGVTPAEVLGGRTYWSLRTDGQGGAAWGPETGTMTDRSGWSISPDFSAGNVLIPEGYYSGWESIVRDWYLEPGNIAAGVTIYGITGTLVPKPIVMYGLGVYHTGALGASAAQARAAADSMCRSSSRRPTVGLFPSARAFMSFSASDEIRDMTANYGVPPDSPVVGPTGGEISRAFHWLAIGYIDNSMNSAGVSTITWWMSGTQIDGSVSPDNCAGFTTSSSGSSKTYGHMNVSGDWPSTRGQWLSFGTSGCDGVSEIVCIAW